MSELGPPLPPGVSPITAGRMGLWLLGKRNQRAAQRRTVSVVRDYPICVASRFAHLFAPWTIAEYPGWNRILPHFCGVSVKTSKQWIYGYDKLPAKHARTLAAVARSRATEWALVAAELEALAAEPVKLQGAARARSARHGEQV